MKCDAYVTIKWYWLNGDSSSTQYIISQCPFPTDLFHPHASNDARDISDIAFTSNLQALEFYRNLKKSQVFISTEFINIFHILHLFTRPWIIAKHSAIYRARAK